MAVNIMILLTTFTERARKFVICSQAHVTSNKHVVHCMLL